MKTKMPNALFVWKQMEDHLVPQLRFSTTDRAVYSYLVRHSRLEGKLRLRFSMAWLARGARVCDGAARPSVRRLLDHGALRLVERTKAGHIVEVRLPEEIPALRRDLLKARKPAPHSPAATLEDLDFFKTRALRQAIHARERGRCFYCLRPTNPRNQCIDHVVPRVAAGRNSYRNLVSSCLECNSQKCDRSAPEFLCWLYREHRLTDKQLTARLRALDALASGKLRPPLPATV
jgi:5-methylcytosine-specific restriction endonuclease McrA